MPETEREVKKEQRRKASGGETQTKDGAFMSHKLRGKKRPSAIGGEKKEQILRGEEGETECEGGRKLLLEQLVTAETT